MPFLSGQIFVKCFESSDGLSLSIGMQYLGEEKRSISMTVDTVKNQPYCMQPIPQSFLSRLASDKFLDSLQLVFTACLESAGVVENVSIVVREDKFILNVVMATLSAGSLLLAVSAKNMAIEPLLWGRV